MRQHQHQPIDTVQAKLTPKFTSDEQKTPTLGKSYNMIASIQSFFQQRPSTAGVSSGLSNNKNHLTHLNNQQNQKDHQTSYDLYS
jgi:hypothetical protein